MPRAADAHVSDDSDDGIAGNLFASAACASAACASAARGSNARAADAHVCDAAHPLGRSEQLARDAMLSQTRNRTELVMHEVSLALLEVLLHRPCPCVAVALLPPRPAVAAVCPCHRRGSPSAAPAPQSAALRCLLCPSQTPW